MREKIIIKMIGQMKYTMIENNNNIVSTVEKLIPAPGDIFLFLIKTDDQGMPSIDLETVQQTADMMGEVLGKYGAKGIFLFDKIYLFSIEDSERIIESLKKTISYISEAVDQALDIENGVFEEAVEIQMRDTLGLG